MSMHEVHQHAIETGRRPSRIAGVFAVLSLLGALLVLSVAGSSSSAAPVTTSGYRVVSDDGGVSAFGEGVSTYGASLNQTELNEPIVGTAATPSGLGYWLVASDGGIFSYGDAEFEGSLGSIVLNQPIVGMASTPSGQGYWLVASDGGIFAFGDAGFEGSLGSIVLNEPIVGMSATPSGEGYWLVASDGGIFAFGDAEFYGSMGGEPLNLPVVGMASTSTGAGYWMTASDGGIFAFGDANFYGSTGNIALVSPVVGMIATPTDQGYLFVAADGGVFSYGDSVFLGSATSTATSDVVGMAWASGTVTPTTTTTVAPTTSTTVAPTTTTTTGPPAGSVLYTIDAASDPAGNVYAVGQTDPPPAAKDCLFRKITPTGDVSTITLDTETDRLQCAEITVGDDGDIYVIGESHTPLPDNQIVDYLIRHFDYSADPTGATYTDIVLAQNYLFTSLTVDHLGNLYALDGNTVVSISSTGVTTPVPPTNASPTATVIDLAVDANNNIYGVTLNSGQLDLNKYEVGTPGGIDVDAVDLAWTNDGTEWGQISIDGAGQLHLLRYRLGPNPEIRTYNAAGAQVGAGTLGDIDEWVSDLVTPGSATYVVNLQVRPSFNYIVLQQVTGTGPVFGGTVILESQPLAP